MQTVEEIYQPYIKPLPSNEKLRLTQKPKNRNAVCWSWKA